MKRTPIVMSATVFGTAAILGFHAHQPSVPLAAASASTSTSTSASSSSSTSTSSRSAGTSGTAASTGSGNGTALGDPMNTRYGIAQVRVTVSGGKITKIEAVQLQNGDPKSAAISSYAEPVLQQSALAKQTAAVDTVSGATYTSLSYEGSLQSALDKLGFKSADGNAASTDMSQLQ